MDKIKFIGFTIFAVTVAYIFLTILMPLLTEVSGDSADELEGDPHADAYVLPVAGLRYAPLVLYFIPAAVGVTAIVLKLKQGAS